jgi:urease accessory protein
MASAAESLNNGWYAGLRLGFRKSPGRTVLAERKHQGPLAVQRAFYPEGDLCHVYLLHPPGGIAGGDRLDIRARVDSQASALVTTPGATKFYRSIGPAAVQTQRLSLHGGSLEWLPQENILFPGAKAELSTQVHLKGDAAFIGWEINCLGRPAIDESFDAGHALFSFSIFRDDLPLLHERLTVDSVKSLYGAAGLRNQPVVASLYATTEDEKLTDSVRSQIPEKYRPQLGVTLVDGLLIIRYLGDSTERARRLFIDIWKVLRPSILNRTPSVPRIWNT